MSVKLSERLFEVQRNLNPENYPRMVVEIGCIRHDLVDLEHRLAESASREQSLILQLGEWDKRLVEAEKERDKLKDEIQVAENYITNMQEVNKIYHSRLRAASKLAEELVMTQMPPNLQGNAYAMGLRMAGQKLKAALGGEAEPASCTKSKVE